MKEIVPVRLTYSVPSAGAQKQPETQKAWVPHLKKNKGDFYFNWKQKPVQHVPGGENKGCYFSLMTALGSEIEHSR